MKVRMYAEQILLKNLLNAGFSSRELAVNIANSLGMNIDRSFYCITLISALQAESKGLELLKALFADKGDVNAYGMEIFDQEQYLFVLFTDKEEDLETWVNNAKFALSALDNEAVIAVSNTHVDFSEATNAYLRPAQPMIIVLLWK